MDNVIQGYFDDAFRAHIAEHIKNYGIKRTLIAMDLRGHHPSFAKAIVRSITRKEGW